MQLNFEATVGFPQFGIEIMGQPTFWTPVVLTKTVLKGNGEVSTSSAFVPGGGSFLIHPDNTICFIVHRLLFVASKDSRAVHVYQINSGDSKDITSDNIIHLKNLERNICKQISRRAYRNWKYQVRSIESSDSGTCCLTVKDIIERRMIITIDSVNIHIIPGQASVFYLKNDDISVEVE